MYTDDELSIPGNVIRFMWDYTVTVPLWAGGLLPEDPEWLRGALGLSDALVEDMTKWGTAMCKLDGEAGATREEYTRLDAEARTLVQRLKDEVPARFRVVYQPWL